MVKNALKILENKYNIEKVDVAIVAGSGLFDALPKLKDVIEVLYEDLGIPKSKVQGHSGKFVFGKYQGKNLVFVSRIHYYENGNLDLVRLPFEIVSGLGAKSIVLLTSSGGINNGFRVGDIMLINDHINLAGVNPLIGIENLQFTNMNDCYNAEWRNKARNVAKKNNISLKEGVFVQMSGPSYETKAEINMLKMLGCDAVSMSTAFDCIICNYLGLKVIGFSVIVNTFSGKGDELNHKEVLSNAKKASQNLKIILQEII